jgi:hypothetical protein
MMEEFEQYLQTGSFTKAAKEARWLAKVLAEDTKVCRNGSVWIVLVPSGAREQLIGPARDEHDPYDDYLTDESALRNREYSSDQDDWARSNSQGWFYDD